MGILEYVAAGVLLIWIGIVADRKRWWPREWALPKATEDKGSADQRVTVIIPARNEASTLPAVLPPLLRQTQHVERCVVVDDGSTDGTAAVARSCGEEDGAELVVLEAGPRPAEWTGKLHALQAGVRHVEPTAAPDAWYLFTDADIQHPSDSVARLLARARDDYDLVSVMVRLRAESFWEKLLIPPFVYFFQLMYPFRRVSDPHSKVAAAAGGCVLLRRSVLDRSGGLANIRSALIDDVSLARQVKSAGGRLWLGLDPQMESLRRYNRLGEIVDMVARTAFTELRYRYWRVLVAWASLALVFVSPPVLCLAGLATARYETAVLAAVTWLIQAATFFPAVRHQRVASPLALSLPVAAILYGYMTGVSAWRHFRGRGVRWRESLEE